MDTTELADSLKKMPLVTRSLAALVISLALYWVVQWWNYPPAVEYDNLKYIQLLRTAVSSKRPDWVEKVKNVVHDRFESGVLSKREKVHFEKVISLADDEQWDAAHKVCFQFEEAQLNRRRATPPSAEHSHSHE